MLTLVRMMLALPLSPQTMAPTNAQPKIHQPAGNYSSAQMKQDIIRSGDDMLPVGVNQSVVDAKNGKLTVALTNATNKMHQLASKDLCIACASTNARQDTLRRGEQLDRTRTTLISQDGQYRAVLQGDGNFVVYGHSVDGIHLRTVWSLWEIGGLLGDPGTNKLAYIALQGQDGNLAFHNAAENHGLVYATSWDNCYRHCPDNYYCGMGDELVMQNDGNLVLYRHEHGDPSNRKAVWESLSRSCDHTPHPRPLPDQLHSPDNFA